jgi:Arc/MetJ-type ribon-helix-helix transcriptional regulator
MTIEIRKPELEALIRERMQTGRFQSIEEALLQALRLSPSSTGTASSKHSGLVPARI